MKIKRNEEYSWLGNSDPDEMIERRAEEEKALCVAFHSKRSNFSPANFPPFDNSYCVNFRAFKLLNFASTRFASPPSVPIECGSPHYRRPLSTFAIASGGSLKLSVVRLEI